jgi:hypothetical protein
MILPPCGWALAAIWVCLELFQLTGEARLAYFVAELPMTTTGKVIALIGFTVGIGFLLYRCDRPCDVELTRLRRRREVTLKAGFVFLMCGLRRNRNNVYGARQIRAAAKAGGNVGRDPASRAAAQARLKRLAVRDLLPQRRCANAQQTSM